MIDLWESLVEMANWLYLIQSTRHHHTAHSNPSSLTLSPMFPTHRLHSLTPGTAYHSPWRRGREVAAPQSYFGKTVAPLLIYLFFFVKNSTKALVKSGSKIKRRYPAKITCDWQLSALQLQQQKQQQLKLPAIGSSLRYSYNNKNNNNLNIWLQRKKKKKKYFIRKTQKDGCNFEQKL